MKLLLKTVGLLVLLLLLGGAGLLLAIQYAGADFQRALVTALLEHVSGGEVSLGKEFHLRLGGNLELQAEDVRLEKARLGPLQEYRAQQLQLSLSLPALLQRRLEFRLRQQGGLVRLISTEEPSEEESSLFIPIPRQVEVRDLALFLPREPSGTPRKVLLSRLSLRQTEQELLLDLEGSYGDQPLQVKTTLAPQADAKGRHALQLKGRLGRLVLHGKGWQGPGSPSLELDLDMSAPDLRIMPGSPFDALAGMGPARLSLRLIRDGRYHAEKVRLEMEVGKATRLRAEGRIEDLVTGEGMQLTLQAESTDLSELSKKLRLQLPSGIRQATLSGRLLGRYSALDLEGVKLKLRGKELSLELAGDVRRIERLSRTNLQLSGEGRVAEQALEIELRLGADEKNRRSLQARLRSGEMELRGDGFVSMERGTPRLELALAGKAGNLKQPAALLGLELQPVAPVTLTGKLAYRRPQLALTGLELRAGRNDLAGDLRLSDLGKAPMKVEGSIRSHRIHLGELLSERVKIKPKLVEKGEKVSRDELAGKHGKKFFSRQSFDLSWMKALQGRLALHFDRWLARNYRLENIDTELLLTNGELRMDRIVGRIGNSPLKGAGRIDTRGKPLAASFELAFGGADLAGAFPGFGLPPGSGTVDMELDLRSRGDSPAELAANLDGIFRLGVEDAPFGFGLPRTLEKSLLEHFNPLARKEPGARRLDCAALYLELKRGQAKMPRGMVIAFPKVLWAGEGSLDLRNETLYLTLKPHTRKGITLFNRGLADLVAVAGPFSAPYIVLNPSGTLLTTLSYSAAAYTGGVSLLLEEIWERVTRVQDPCGYVLQGKRSSAAGKADREKSNAKGSLLDQLDSL